MSAQARLDRTFCPTGPDVNVQNLWKKMSLPRDEQLERRFADAGLSRHLLYPWWYRTFVALGLKLRPPVEFSYAEHLLYGGVTVVAMLILALAIQIPVTHVPVRMGTALTLASLVVVVPTMNWLRYRRIRRRIGWPP